MQKRRFRVGDVGNTYEGRSVLGENFRRMRDGLTLCRAVESAKQEDENRPLPN
ncbi:hypothetical protein THTE_2469 [Thermogutta terrifontis]|uniref:Uncharacterized protein n=1 Tax=Thermogutta terrifontis TaxID=1331910 RepID=A0A286RGI9_9BACT|nr:hypothetical protein THTE_2469 [Thermogutta terrifontis]